jgi:putative ATP-dependent endonuclease of OLD family
LPFFAEYINKPLEVNHVAIVRVDGVTFKHFIKLFGAIPEERRKYSLSRKVSCLLDTDPSKKESNKPNSRWKSCWPFEIRISPQDYTYRAKSGVISNLEEISKSDNIGLFYNRTGKGKTLEYDLALDNANCSLLSDSTFSLSDDEDLIEILDRANFSSASEREKAHFAASYLMEIEKRENKGENAFDLEHRLRENLRNTEGRIDISIPEHITRAIKWACGDIET